MSNPAQRRAIDSYRRRLGERGMARFEVVGLERDRDLIRSLARRLAENGGEAAQLRAEVSRKIAAPVKRGGVLAALRRSPLVGTELDVSREVTTGRQPDL